MARRKNSQTGLYFPNTTPMRAIRRYATEIAQQFNPEKIVLFGSYANGSATPDSDVDLLVIMRTRNQVEQAVVIDEAITVRGFPLDLIVRTPKFVGRCLRSGDSFYQQILANGKTLYEKNHTSVAAKSPRRPRRGSAPLQAQTAAQR
jgi:predicted nucleotidyltransferase